MPAFQSAHLDLEDCGLVWLRCLPNAHLLEGESCGLIGNPAWPCKRLGDEPDWFEREIVQLQAWWEEERRIGEQELRLLEAEYVAMCLGNPR